MSRAAANPSAPQVRLAADLNRVLQGWDDIARVMVARVYDRFPAGIEFDITIPRVGYVNELSTDLSLTEYEAGIAMVTCGVDAEVVRQASEYVDACNVVQNCNTSIRLAREVFEKYVNGGAEYE